MTYANRATAGEVLAPGLAAYAGRPDTVVLGLVRGGVPVAARVSARLGLPLDVLVVRKLGVPAAPEVAFGAIGEGGVVVHNPAVEALITRDEIAAVIATESAELERRLRIYRSPPESAPERGVGEDLVGRCVIVVDDGLATGATARAAVEVCRAKGASRVVLAVPVAAPAALRQVPADEVVCPLIDPDFIAVGAAYGAFPQVTDAEVRAALG